MRGSLATSLMVPWCCLSRKGKAAACLAAACLAGWLFSASAGPDPIAFEDVASRAGVEFILQNAATGDKHQIETMIAGVAVFDYNNDGWPDLYFVNGASQPNLEKTNPAYYNRLYRNNGNGTFSDVTMEAGVRGEGFAMGVAAADYDNDGATDLFIAGVNRNVLYRNRGDGTFEDVTGRAGLAHEGSGMKPWSVSAGWFDYDNDGLLDLFVVNYCVWTAEKDPYRWPDFRS